MGLQPHVSGTRGKDGKRLVVTDNSLLFQPNFFFFLSGDIFHV